uniref:Solute carrier family 15 member 1b n=1 Tax=Hucho hucho TaxID=62062 RepID=A0A4W5Q041_9TELE
KVKSKKSQSVCYSVIFFIVVNEFCERFSYYGMRAVLVLYFRYFLKWDDDLATSIYHTFIALCYLTPILGAIVADSWLGKFKTIVYLSIVYTVGQVVMAVSAIHDITDTDRDGTPDNMTFHVAMSMLGLFLIALGTGGIKPCVAAFGGDQFEDHQEKQRSTFFSIFYLSINAGSLLSTVITPILRAQECGIHSQQKCYPLAFGVPAALMVVALSEYCYPPIKCNRFRHRSKKFPKREHWMDWADEKYDKLLVAQVKMVLKVLFLYIPLPMFWTLFDQQGSRWTLQATTMDGNFGILIVQPDQMQVSSTLFCFNCDVFLQQTLPKLPKGVAGQVKFLNLNNAPLTVTIDGTTDVSVPAHQASHLASSFISCGPKKYSVLSLKTHSDPCLHDHDPLCFLQVNTGDYLTFDKPVRVMFNKNTSPAKVFLTCCFALSYCRFVNGLGSVLNVTLGVGDIAPLSVSNYSLVPQGKAEFTIMNRGGASCLYSIELGFGSAFTLVIPTTFNIVSPDCWQAIQVVEDVKPNTIHMGWQIPQYFLMTAGEVVFSVTGLEFSYSQAPSNMKSVLQAGWLFTVAVGNIIVLIVAEAAQLPDQWAEYILFASLLVVVCIVFAVMSYFYTYTDPAEIEAEFKQPEHEPEEKKRDSVEMESKDLDCSKDSDKNKRDSVVEQQNQEVKQSKM